MHIKTISNTVAATVTLGEGSYGKVLTVAETGAVEPPVGSVAAIVAPSSIGTAKILNLGVVAGAAGATQGNSGGGGGAGIYFASAGNLNNQGAIAGGSGAYGTLTGGAGGAGVVLDAAAKIENSGKISGGAGGYASEGRSGGAGGAGFYLGVTKQPEQCGHD